MLSRCRRRTFLALVSFVILHCGSVFAVGLTLRENDVANDKKNDDTNDNAEEYAVTKIPINPTQSPHATSAAPNVSPPTPNTTTHAPTLVPNHHNTTTSAPTIAPHEKNTTTIVPSVQPHNETTHAPSTMHPSSLKPVTTAPATHAPTKPAPSSSPSAAPTTFTPPPRPSRNGHGILQILGRTIAWMILLFLATVAFGGIMQHRYRIYYFLRGCWYTLLSLSCTRWIMAKLRLSDYYRNRGVDDSLNTILFENELNEGLLMRETDT